MLQYIRRVARNPDTLHMQNIPIEFVSVFKDQR